MHRELISIVRCPKCNKSGFTITEDRSENNNIINGTLFCPDCKIMFKIQNDALDLRYNLSKTCLDEIEATRRETEKRTDPEKDQLKEKKYENLDFGEMSLANYYGIDGFIKDGDGKISLDLGTGGGWLAAFLSRKGYLSVGIDLSDTRFVDDFGKEFNLILTDMGMLPFDDSSIDLISSSSAIHHAPSLKSTLKEISRILKPDGQVVIINEPVSALLRRRRDYGHEREKGANENCYWVHEYIQFSKKAGLKPRLFFPGYIEKKLNNNELKNLPFGRTASIFSFLFKTKGINKISKAMLKYPFYLIFGPQLVMIAKK